MIKIEHPVFPSPDQWMFAIEGARNAYDSWHLSDSYIGHTTEYDKERNVEIWHPCFCMGEIQVYLKDLQEQERITEKPYDHCQLDYELHLITHGGRRQIHIKLEQQDVVALRCTQFIKKSLT